jgi:hypothetical protein
MIFWLGVHSNVQLTYSLPIYIESGGRMYVLGLLLDYWCGGILGVIILVEKRSFIDGQKVFSPGIKLQLWLKGLHGLCLLH